PISAGSQAFEPVVSNVPVLILSGEYDPVCPPVFGEITAKTLSNSTFVVVPSESHAAIHADDCLRKMAADFLQSPSTKPTLACVSNRPDINFISKNLKQALTDMKSKK